MTDIDGGNENGNVVTEPLGEALSKRYLAYALSTITARALPDVRDGLKPVQRRILYAMRELRLDPDASFRKCAKIVGDVIGNFHPHGDASVYDTMVRLAQDFSVRYPLVDGQGNFGNIDGDSAAAMRYTESRMTAAANLLLEGLDEDAVDFRETYDEKTTEPVVLPAGYPNLLANGATGIAVGMATSIPPHNASEVIDAALLLVKKRSTPLRELLNVMPGPDFPTGGTIVEARSAIETAYETGRGAFRLRARWHVEELGRGTWQIVVTEIPYQIQKSRLIERLASLIETKKTAFLDDVRDESAEDLRIVLVPRSKTAPAEVMMENLFKLSDLESRFNMNLTVLHEGAPQVMGLKPILLAYLDHRREVVQRRARFRLGKIEARLHLLDGYLTAFLNIDEVIRIIRTEDEPKPVLMARFELTEMQAEAILNLRLRALRKLEEVELRGEHERLSAERATLVQLLESERRQWTRVGKELKAARKAFDPSTELGRRRADFGDAPDIDLGAALEASLPKEPVTVVLSEQGWLRALKGHGQDPSRIKYKDGDAERFIVEAMTHERLILLTTDGRAFSLAADQLPGGRGHGEPVRLSLTIPPEVGIADLFRLRPGRKRVMASSAGYGFIVDEADLASTRKAGKQALTVPSGAEALPPPVAEGDRIALVTDKRKLLVTGLDELPEMQRGKGVKLIALSGKAALADLSVFAAETGLVAVQRERTRSFSDWEDWMGKRAQSGKAVPKGFPRNGRLRG